jgi:hypothetical protein
MSLIAKSAAGRAYTRRILSAMGLYVVFLVIAVKRLAQPAPSHATAVFLSLLPAIPIVAVIVIVGLYLRDETDEFQRALLTEALLWGMGATLAVTSIWGFLENFHQARHFPAFYTFMIFWLFVGLAGIVQRLRYRVASDD